MDKWKKLELPRYALTFAGSGTVEGKEITMTANSGRSFAHPYWKKLALDLGGMTIKKDRLPILWGHDQAKILGFFDKKNVAVNGGVNIEGSLVDSTTSREFASLAVQGTPFQASVFGSPSKIEKVEEGQETEVNGLSFEGPGHVWRTWELREAGPALWGFDSRTEVNVFSFSGSQETEFCMVTGLDPDELLAQQIFASQGEPENFVDVSDEDSKLADELFAASGGQGDTGAEKLSDEDNKLVEQIFSASRGN